MYVPNAPPALTDEQLKELQPLAAGGDQFAINTIINGNIRRVVVIAKAFAAKKPCFADEFLDAALTRLVECVHRMPKDHENPSGYILSAVVGAMRDVLRSSRLYGGNTRNKNGVKQGAMPVQTSRGHQFESVAVQEILEQFSEIERKMITLRMEDHTDEEIGKILNQSRVSISRMRAEVKSRLKGYFP